MSLSRKTMSHSYENEHFHAGKGHTSSGLFGRGNEGWDGTMYVGGWVGKKSRFFLEWSFDGG
jgi:hypothetical protein